jgi:hypothetical protein
MTVVVVIGLNGGFRAVGHISVIHIAESIVGLVRSVLEGLARLLVGTVAQARNTVLVGFALVKVPVHAI